MGTKSRILIGLIILSVLLLSSAIASISNSSSAVSSLKLKKVPKHGNGVATIGVGNQPVGIISDPVTGDIWVANNGTSTISIIAPKTDTVVSAIYTYNLCECGLINPEWMAYDNYNGLIYITFNNGAVDSGTIGAFFANNASLFGVITSPQFIKSQSYYFYHLRGLAYDPSNQEMYALDAAGSVYEFTSELSCFRDTNCLIDYTQVGGSYDNVGLPYGLVVDSGIAYDPANREMYVSNAQYTNGFGYINAISSVSNQVVATISVDQLGNYTVAPAGIAYNPIDQDMHVAVEAVYGDLHPCGSGECGGLSYGEAVEISSATNNVVASYYTGLNGCSSVQIEIDIDSLGYSIPCAELPLAIAFNPSDNSMYFTSLANSTNILYPNAASWNSVGVVNTTSTNSAVSEIYNQTYYSFGMAYSSISKQMYVTNTGSSTVTVIGVNSYVPAAAVTLSTTGSCYEQEPAYSSNGGNFFVADTCNKAVYEVSSTYLTFNALPFSFSGLPEGIGYDTSNQYLYIANNNGTVTVINPQSGAFITDVQIGADTQPSFIAYNPRNGNMYVSDYGSNSVTEINSSTNNVVATLTGFNVPAGIAFDKSNGNLYVVNSNNNTVSVINGKTNQIIGSAISLAGNGAAENIAYDPSNSEMYATENDVCSPGTCLGGDQGLYAINSKTNTVSPIDSFSGIGLLGLAYNPLDGDMFVGGALTACLGNTAPVYNIWSISGSSNQATIISVHGYDNFPVFDSYNGYIFNVGAIDTNGFGSSLVLTTIPG